MKKDSLEHYLREAEMEFRSGANDGGRFVNDTFDSKDNDPLTLKFNYFTKH